MSPTYYKNLSLVLQQAIKGGASIIYRPNLASITGNPEEQVEELALAMRSDPFLREFTDHSALLIRPDVAKGNSECVKDEDRLLRQHGTAIVMGAYSKWCVPATAHYIMSRNPGYRVGIDEALSIDNGGQYVRPEHARVPRLSLSNEMLRSARLDPPAADDMGGSARPSKRTDPSFPRPLE